MGLLTWPKALAQDERMRMKKLEVPQVRMKKQEVSLGEDEKEQGPIAFLELCGREITRFVLPLIN